MARPRLRAGTHGNIRVYREDKTWIATTRVRDMDGRVREVERQGTSRQSASANLQDALDSRPGFGGSELTGDSRLSDVADRWLAEMEAEVDDGKGSPSTTRVYRGVLRKHIKPAIGELQVREATTARLNSFLRLFRNENGPALSKTVRTVLSGVAGFAVREGVIAVNPMRDVARIHGGVRKQARALTDAERERWIAAMEDDEVAVRHDLPDLTRFLLSTGCRIGEALALEWDSVDLDNKQVSIDWTITRLENGGGLVRGSTKTAAGHRTLPLASWSVDMLRGRRARSRGVGPVFPHTRVQRSSRVEGGWRDPSNTARALREARDRAGFGWVTSHAFRKTVATILHDSGLAPREIADQLGHANLRTLDHYIGRRSVTSATAAALEIFGPADDRLSDAAETG
jgi:integrase